MKKSGWVFSFQYFLFFVFHAWSDDRSTLLQEVSQTETVYLQEKGDIQITLSLEISAGEKEHSLSTPFAIEYGLSDVWEIEAEWDTFLFKDTDDEFSRYGAGDLNVGTKYSFLNVVGSNFHVAPGFEMIFPVASIDKDLTDGFMKYEPTIVLAYDIPQWWNIQFFTEIGVALLDRVKEPDDEEDREPKAHELSWDMGFIVPFKNWLMTFEFNWETHSWNQDGQKNEMYLTPGMDCEWLDDWELGVRIEIGINDQADDFKAVGILTYEFDGFGEDCDEDE